MVYNHYSHADAASVLSGGLGFNVTEEPMHDHTSARYKRSFNSGHRAVRRIEQRNALFWISSPLLTYSACNLSITTG